MKKIMYACCMFAGFVTMLCSCNDEQEEKVFSQQKSELLSLEDTFYDDNFDELLKNESSKKSYFSAIKNVYGVDITKVASSSAMSTLDSLKFDSCFIKRLENGLVSETTINRLSEIYDSIIIAETSNDTIAIQNLSTETYNLTKCKPLDDRATLSDLYDAVTLSSFTAKRGIAMIEKSYPNFSKLETSEQQFILALSMYYHQFLTSNNNKVAPIPCSQQCVNRYDKSIARAFSIYAIEMTGCVLALPATNVFGSIACATCAAISLYDNVDKAVSAFNDCLEGCNH